MATSRIVHDIQIDRPHIHVRTYTRPLFVPYEITSTQAYISRAVATLVGNVVCAPFNVVQTLAQVGSKEGRKSYTKIVEDLYNKEGFGAFFKGSLVGAVRFIETAGVNYVVYLGIRKLLADKTGDISSENHQIANALSIIISSIATYPLEAIRTRLILDWENKKYSGVLDCLQNSLSLEGWTGLFQGSVLSAIGNYVMVDVMERIWAPLRIGNFGLTFVPPSFVDAVSQTLLAQTIYYPIDTVLKMVQAPAAYKHLHSDVEFDGAAEAASATISKHGFTSLWRGYTISALQVIPYITAVSIAFAGTTRFFDQLNGTTVVVRANEKVVVMSGRPNRL